MEPRIRDLNFSKRTKRALIAAGFDFLHEVGVLPRHELLKIDELGEKGVEEIFMICAILLPKPSRSSEPFDSDPEIKNLSAFSARLKNTLLIYGCTNFSDILKLDIEQFKKTDNVGAKTINELIKVRAAPHHFLDQQQPEKAATNDVTSAALLTVPDNFDEGKSFIENCRVAFDQYCSHLTEREKAIATQRIWPEDDHKRATLEAIANEFQISRQRVEQVEKKLLQRLLHFFCHGSPVLLKSKGTAIKLHNKISSSWLALAKVLINFEEIDLKTFVSALADKFSISRSECDSILSLASCIFTQSVANYLSANYRQVPSCFIELEKLNGVSLKLNLNKLHLGAINKTLREDHALETLSDLKNSAMELPLNLLSRSACNINPLVKSISADGYIDWELYRAELGLITFPLRDRDFSAQDIIDSVRSIIPYITSWKDCESVFSLRTSLPSDRRMTLKQLSITLLESETRGPNIAKIEKYLLEELARVLIYRDFSEAKCWVNQNLLDFFRDVQVIFTDAKGFEDFESRLHSSGIVTAMDNEGFPHLIWSIVDGLPPNRYFHLSKAHKRRIQKQKSNYPLPDKIKLKGFKKIF